eukprot:8381474-Pyramimonas_sp.AAC.1
MEGGSRSPGGSRLSAAHILPSECASASQLEGGSSSQCGPRLRAATVRLKVRRSFTDGGQTVF